MRIKGLIDEDFVNYRKPSMFVAFPTCTFKCERECGIACCQNSPLAKAEDIEVRADDVVLRYMDNPITKALVLGGLEPFDSYGDMLALIEAFRRGCQDDVVIYTGYREDELSGMLDPLRGLGGVIVKFGRYRPGESPHRDEVLGVDLASSNQYAKRI